MQDDSKFIVDSIQSILDAHNGFVAVSKLPPLMSAELKTRIGIKSKASPKILMKKLEPLFEEEFLLHSKGKSLYLLTRQEPAEFVLALLSEDKPLTVKEIADVLKPFTKKDVADIVAELVNTKSARVAIDEKYTWRVLAAGGEARSTEPVHQKVVKRAEYTMGAMRRAYDELHKFRNLVRICDVRRSLGWPRETFDEMIRTLRDNRTIQIFRADESLFTRDEIQDCFVDENNFIMGTVIWNGR